MGKALKIILCQVLSENLLAWRVLSVLLPDSIVCAKK